MENPIVVREYVFKKCLYDNPMVVSTSFLDTGNKKGYVIKIEHLPVRSLRYYKSDIIDFIEDFDKAIEAHNQIIKGWKNA